MGVPRLGEVLRFDHSKRRCAKQKPQRQPFKSNCGCPRVANTTSSWSLPGYPGLARYSSCLPGQAGPRLGSITCVTHGQDQSGLLRSDQHSIWLNSIVQCMVAGACCKFQNSVTKAAKDTHQIHGNVQGLFHLSSHTTKLFYSNSIAAERLRGWAQLSIILGSGASDEWKGRQSPRGGRPRG